MAMAQGAMKRKRRALESNLVNISVSRIPALKKPALYIHRRDSNAETSAPTGTIVHCV
jgi:hypothetical protein